MDFIAWVLVAVCFAVALAAILLRPDLLAPRCLVCSKEIDANPDAQELWIYLDSPDGWQASYCAECLSRRHLPVLSHEETARRT